MISRTEKYKERNNKEEKIIKKDKQRKRRKKRYKMLTILLILISITFIYARIIEPNMLKVKEYKIETDKISENMHGIKIVHFSDLHYGSTITKNNIKKIINKINFLEPDIVVFTGDLIEENYGISKTEKDSFVKLLKSIKSKLGKYAIIGNHDFYNQEVDNLLYDSDFKLLSNEYDLIYNKDNNPIVIYGVDDSLYGEPSIDKLTEENLDEYYKILLTHEPDYIDEVKDKFDLVLSGHSHNGQVKFPGLNPIWTPVGSRNYYDSYYKVGNSELYISNGLGTSEIKLRLGSVPSINLFRITKK